MARLKQIGHEDRLSLVDHLDELRTRVIVSVLTFGVAFGLCVWQNHLILDVLDEPLDGRQPLTLGVAEPFMTTLTVSAYVAIVISLPVVLYQLYAFVLPAFSPSERRLALPILLMIPALFIAGVVFGYFVVLPNAVEFLQDFNADEFNTQIRAREYYSFVALTLLALGVLFQIPIGILAATRMGITTPAKLRKNRRYAIVLIAVIAMLLPGVDPVTMLISMVPLIVLFELSILLAAAFGRPSRDVAERVASAEGS